MIVELKCRKSELIRPVKQATSTARATSIGSVYWDVNVAGLSFPRFAPRKLFRNEPSNAHHKLLAEADPSYLLTRSCHYKCLEY